MGLERDGCSKMLSDDGQGGGIEGSGMLDGPQGGTEAAEKSRGIDGCKDFLLDGPQRGKINKMSRKGNRVQQRDRQ